MGGEPTDGPCALCAGHTPRQSLALGDHGVEVVAHGLPGLRVERAWRDPRGDRAPAVGAHEVIIEGAAHDWQGWSPRLALLREHLRLRDARIDDLLGDVRLASFVWVRDQGTGLAPPGTHPHGQLFALPVAVDATAVPERAPRLVLCEQAGAWAAVATAPSGDFTVDVVAGTDPAATALVLWRVLVALERCLAAPPVSLVQVRSRGGPGTSLRVRPWLDRPGGLDLVAAGFLSWEPEEAADRVRQALP